MEKKNPSNKEGSMSYVFFHGGCMDGLGALWSFVLGQKESDAYYFRYIPHIAGKVVDREIFEGALVNVYFLDCSPVEGDLPFLKEIFGKIYIYDHHKLDLSLYKGAGCNVVHDINRSGATITWDIYHNSEARPVILNYIQDRDLWTWKLKDSKAVSEYLFKNIPLPKREEDVHDSLVKFSKVKDELEVCLEEVIAAGKLRLQVADEHVKTLVSMSRKAKWAGKYTVYHCETRAFRSEVGSRLMENKDADFAICWSFSLEDKMFWLSLRSTPGKVDVATICKAFGGGGHVCSSGMSLTFEEFTTLLQPLDTKDT